MLSNQGQQELSEEKMIIIQQNSFVSESIGLPSGKTAFQIISFGENNGLDIKFLENISDNSYYLDYFLLVFGPFLIIALMI
jgi:hypothetical protein